MADTSPRLIFAMPWLITAAHRPRVGFCDSKPKKAEKVEVDGVTTENVGAVEDVLRSRGSAYHLEI
jgi:hypothetical protein